MPESTCLVAWCLTPPGTDGLHCKLHRDYLRRKGRLPTRPTYWDERRRLHERIDIDADTGCWNWTGTLKENGYGDVHFRGRHHVAHRAMWLLERGPVPIGLDLDHLCRNRRCINPDHLEPVTREENLRRGDGTLATATHCAKGHLWADGNERRDSEGTRVCLTCGRDQAREYQRRKRAERRSA